MGGAIFIGIISGLIASVILYLALFTIKPRVVLSNYICQQSEGNKCYIKLVNFTNHYLMDVNYSLHFCHYSADGIISMEPIDFDKRVLDYISPHRKSDKSAKYAVRIAFSFDAGRLKSKEDYLLFTFSAKHSVTGSIAFFHKNTITVVLKMDSFRRENR